MWMVLTIFATSHKKTDRQSPSSVTRKKRLTQPGKIAIGYSQHKEQAEYLEYIEFLQAENLLGEEVEHLDLEDTQGISGLKAIRVDVNYTSDVTITPKEAFTRVGAEGLIRK